MKIAVIDHFVNHGGGSRYLRCLLPAIKRLHPKWHIDFYGNWRSVLRENLLNEFQTAGIFCKPLRSTALANREFFKLKSSKAIITFLQRRYAKILSHFPFYFSGAVHKEMEEISKGYDLLFCPWPYLAECPRVHCPLVAVFHDFNFRYYFTGPTWHPLNLSFLMKEIPRWLEISTPVVSTHFMKSELEKFYPEHADKTRLAHISSMSTISSLTKQKAESILKKWGIKKKYLLYPTNLCSHKNVGSLIAAFGLLRNQGFDLSLVFAGSDTEAVNGRVAPWGMQVGTKDQEVFGLGYVSNEEIDALIQCASVVVSTSLYEAGNGPGLDAWAKGVPVAMSNIPAFTEHLQWQGVKAMVFDPRSPQDIAEKIAWILTHPEEAKEMASISKEAMNLHSWEETGKKYAAIFQEAIHG